MAALLKLGLIPSTDPECCLLRETAADALAPDQCEVERISYSYLIPILIRVFAVVISFVRTVTCCMVVGNHKSVVDYNGIVVSNNILLLFEYAALSVGTL